MRTARHTLAVGRPLLAGGLALLCFNLISGSVHAFPPQQCDPPPPGIVAWWPGEGNANDLLGGNNGIPQGGVTYTAGKVGEAFSFDGSTGFLATSDQVNNPQSFTLECWFKTAVAQGPGGVLIGFCGDQTDTGGGYDRFIYLDDDGFLHFGVYNNNPFTADSPLPYNDGGWHHVAATLSTTTGASLYVDGTLVANNPNVTSAQNYNGYWRIGEDNINGWPYQPSSSQADGEAYFYGAMDEVSIYARVLSAAQIQSIYNAGSAGKCPLPSATYVGNSLTGPVTESGPDGVVPLVILGEYSPAPPSGSGPLSTSPNINLPGGTLTDVQFYGGDYAFYFYVLRPLGPGSNPSEQMFKVLAAQGFSGSAPAGIQDLQTPGWAVSPGDLLAFCGVGPYYVGANDAPQSDATYESSGNGNFFAFAPSTEPGTTFTVGVNPDPNATYEYVPDFFTDQGRTYAIGVAVVESSGVVPPAMQLQVVTPPTATAGQAVNVTVNALDALGNPTTATATVTITSTDPNAALPAVTVNLIGGTATFPVTFETAGAQTVTATDTAQNNPLMSGTSPGVTVNSASATQLQVVGPLTATAGQPINVTVNALDASGDPTTATVTVTISSTDPAVPATTMNLVGGTATFQVTFETAGTQTVTASDTAQNNPLSSGTSSSVTVSLPSGQAILADVLGAATGPEALTVNYSVTEDALGLYTYTYTVNNPSGDVLLNNDGSMETTPEIVDAFSVSFDTTVSGAFTGSQTGGTSQQVNGASGLFWSFVAVSPGQSSPPLSFTSTFPPVMGNASASDGNPPSPWSSYPNGQQVPVPAVPEAPLIVSAPQNQSVAAGGSATFNVTASGSGVLNYQWQFYNGVNNGTLPNNAQAAGSQLSLNNVTLANAGTYTVIVSNPYGSVMASATLAVLIESSAGTPGAVLADVLGAASGPEALTVNYAVTEDASGLYTYTYTVNNPSGDVLLNNDGSPTTTPEIVDAFAVSFDTTVSGAFTGSQTGGTSLQVNGASGLFWSFVAVSPGQSSPTLSFQSTFPPVLGNASASDGNPPSPWSSYPNGQQVPVPGGPPSIVNMPVAAGQAILADVLGAATGPEALTVNYSVTEDALGLYTYTYTVNNPSGDVLLNNDGTPSATPEIVDAFSVSFDTTVSGAFTGSQTGGTSQQVNGASGLFWSFVAVSPGQSSPPLSFTSTFPPVMGNASASDGNPPSPWSSYPNGQQVPVPAVPEAPLIVSAPQNQSVAAGGSATFNVTASGSGVLNYQWQFYNGVNNGTLPNNAQAAGSQLSLNNVTLANAGTYTVIVSNPYGSVMASATLAVLIESSAGTPGAVLADVLGAASGPEALTVNYAVTEDASGLYTYTYTVNNPSGDVLLNNDGSPTTTPEIVDAFAVSFDTTVSGAFTGSQTGGTSLQVNGASGLFWSFVAVSPGQSSPTLSFQSTFPPVLGNASASDGNPPSPWSSYPNGQQVPVPAGPPGIVIPPQNQSVAAGNSATFNVTANGPGLSYQWQFDSGSLPANAQAAGPQLTVNNVTLANAGTYTVTVSNPYGSVMASATLAVLIESSGGTPGAILADVLGTASGPEALTVSWSVTENASDVYTYTYVVNNPSGDVLLNNDGSVSTTPEIVDAFSVSFDTTGSGTYNAGSQSGGASQQNNGVSGLFWSFAAVNPGGSSPSLSFQSANPPVLGNASASDGNPPSPWSSYPNGQQVPVPAGPPVIVIPPQNQSVAAGAAATFNVTANGPGLSYQWQFSGGPLTGITTDAQLTVNNVTLANAGLYTVTVSNPYGSVSASATLAVLVESSAGTPAILADVLGTASGPEALTVSWSVTENASDVYTYTYVVNNPSGDVLLNNDGSLSSTPEIVDAFSVSFDTTASGAYTTGSQSGGTSQQNNGGSGLFWSFAEVSPGSSSPPLSFTSANPPVLGNASASDGNPPSPWSSYPNGQQVAVPASSAPGIASAAYSTISPANASIIANGTSTQTITVQARDAYNNNVTSGGATVVFLLSGSGSLSSPTIDNANGTYTVTLTSPTSIGTATVTATLNGSPVGIAASASSSVITYAPGPLDHFVISAIASPQTAGTPFPITITAQDVNNNTVTSYNSPVTFGGTAGVTGTSGASPFIAGVLSGFLVTPTVAGSGLTVTVTDEASPIAHMGTATITTVNLAGLVLFVSSAGANTISEVSSEGVVSTFTPTSGAGILDQPAGLAFDNSGNLYVANNGNNEIAKITTSGVVDLVVQEGYVNKPTGLAFDSAGNLYISGSGNNKISRLLSGATTPALFANATGPEGLAFGNGTGFLYVANETSSSISEILSTGQLHQTLNSGSLIDAPQGLALDAQGNLYIANSANNTLSILAPQGVQVPTVFVNGGQGLDSPCGVALDSIGNVFVANAGNGTISEVTPTGTTVSTFASGLTAPQWLVVAQVPVCPANIQVNRDAGQCSAMVSFAPTGYPAPTVTYELNGNSIASPHQFPVGVSTVNYTAANIAGSQSCSFTVTVNPDPPVPGPSVLAVAEGQPASVPVAALLQGASSPVAGTLSITGVGTPTSPGGASVTLANGDITYTAAANDFIGTDTIDYTLSDGCVSAQGTIIVTVAPSGSPLTAQSTAQSGQTATVAVPPNSGQGGVTAILNNSSGSPVMVTAATYSSDPMHGQPGDQAFGLGTTYLDLEVSPTGSATGDSMTVYFYYPPGVSSVPMLLYWTGNAWNPVLSSGQTPPLLSQTPNLDGTTSGGRYTVVFSGTSTPAITALTGTVIALAVTVRPNLTITQAGNNVTIFWPAGYNLQQNSNLADPAGWIDSYYPITTVNGISTITITPTTGQLFFRLANP